MFIDSKELIKTYATMEQARMKLFSILLPSTDPEDLDTHQIEFIKTLTDIETKTSVEGEEYIKITINDILPTNAGLSKNVIKFHWLALMNHALKDVNTTFNKLLCVIKIYSPATFWDTDNRSIKVVLDSLRYNRIIPDDRSQFLTHMIIGEVDRENPRTEIYLLEHPENPLWFLPE